MQYFMSGLKKNLSSADSQMRLLHLIKVRPVFKAQRKGPGEDALLSKGPKSAWEQLFIGVARSQRL